MLCYKNSNRKPAANYLFKYKLLIRNTTAKTTTGHLLFKMLFH